MLCASHSNADFSGRLVLLPASLMTITMSTCSLSRMDGILTILAVVYATVWLWLGSQARPQSTVYVRFLSPPHGYTHGLEVLYPGAIPVTRQERLYIPFARETGGDANYQTNKGQSNGYHYPRPSQMFHELGERFRGDLLRQSAESLTPVGLFEGPSSIEEFYRNNPGPSYDPFLVTDGLRLDQLLFQQKGILYFHQVPHQRLVIQTNLERLANNLIPHRLGSIRYGHPFFNYNK